MDEALVEESIEALIDRLVREGRAQELNTLLDSLNQDHGRQQAEGSEKIPVFSLEDLVRQIDRLIETGEEEELAHLLKSRDEQEQEKELIIQLHSLHVEDDKKNIQCAIRFGFVR